ncbi:MAG: response regulator transcription factor [Ktedonobacterales bacterium]
MATAPRQCDEQGLTDEESALTELVRTALMRVGAMVAAGELPIESWQRQQEAVVGTLGDVSGVLACLSEREREVWRLWSTGYLAKEIGERLVLTENTVNTHVQHCRRKLHEKHIVEVGMRRGQWESS